MSTTISLHRKPAVSVRTVRTAFATATAAVGTVLTITGAAIGSDPLAYIAATVALASIHTLNQKGGAV